MKTPSPAFVLPSPPKAAGSYSLAVLAGDLIFLSGFAPRDDRGAPISGVVGADVTVAMGRLLARNVGLTILSVLRESLGDLDRVRRMVRLTGMINAVSGFTEHTQVLDGCSDVLVEVLGTRGRHARTAFGVAALPFNAPVSVECVCETG